MAPQSIRTVALTVLFTGFLVTCGKPEAPSPAEPSASPVSNTAEMTDTASAVALPTEEPIGVADCDAYLTKYVSCVMEKVPEAERPKFQASVQQTRDMWRQLAANPQTRASLARVCTETASATRRAMGAYGCEF